MTEDQFDQLMEAIDGGNAHLRSIRAWVTMFGILFLLGIAISLVSAFHAVVNAGP